MLREIAGLPAHALLVHAAVVLVPLLALVAVGFVALPRYRSRLDWAAILFAVTAPLAALFARYSGVELQRVLVARNYAPEVLRQVTDHRWFGDRTLWASAGLGLATILMVLATGGSSDGRWPAWVRVVLSVVIAALAVLSCYYVYLAGETGARAVWQGVL